MEKDCQLGNYSSDPRSPKINGCASSLTKYSCYSSKPDAFLEEKGDGKISRAQRLGTKSPSCCFCAWESTFCLSELGGAVMFRGQDVESWQLYSSWSSETSSTGLQALHAWESEHSSPEGSICFSLIHFVFLWYLPWRSSVYNCLWHVCQPQERREEGQER